VAVEHVRLHADLIMLGRLGTADTVLRRLGKLLCEEKQEQLTEARRRAEVQRQVEPPSDGAGASFPRPGRYGLEALKRVAPSFKVLGLGAY
jgi:hypothetical protein